MNPASGATAAPAAGVEMGYSAPVLLGFSVPCLVADIAFEVAAGPSSAGGLHLRQSFSKVRDDARLAWPNRLLEWRDRQRDERVCSAS